MEKMEKIGDEIFFGTEVLFGGLPPKIRDERPPSLRHLKVFCLFYKDISN